MWAAHLRFMASECMSYGGSESQASKSTSCWLDFNLLAALFGEAPFPPIVTHVTLGTF